MKENTQGCLSTLSIPPNLHSLPISNHKGPLGIDKRPPSPNSCPLPQTIPLSHFVIATSSLLFPILSPNYIIPKSSSFYRKTPIPLESRALLRYLMSFTPKPQLSQRMRVLYRTNNGDLYSPLGLPLTRNPSIKPPYFAFKGKVERDSITKMNKQGDTCFLISKSLRFGKRLKRN